MDKNAKRAYVLRAIDAIFNGLELDKYDDGEPIMIELLDVDGKSLSRNWLNNEILPATAISEAINRLDKVGIQHYCWGNADSLLHCIRYVRVYWRQRVENAEGEFYNHEVGRTYALFDLMKGGYFKSTRYNNTWYDDSTINWKWRYENRHNIGDWDKLPIEEKVAYINSSHAFSLDFYPRQDDYEDDYYEYEDED